MYGGSSTMILRPDSLQFAFTSLLTTDYPVINEIVRRGVAVLLTKLGSYERHEYSLTANRHLVPLTGIAEAHLARFPSDEMVSASANASGMQYRDPPPVLPWLEALTNTESCDAQWSNPKCYPMDCL
jgi:hypothetical protein